MKLLRIGNTLTVVLDDGTVISSSNATNELFQTVRDCLEQKDVTRIKQLLVPELFKEEKEFIAKKDLIDNIKQMTEDLPELFELKDKALYRKGINLSVPEALALEYSANYNNPEKMEALDNFWMWCSLNPNPESREDLFRFLSLHGMPITKQGMFLAYRRVRSLTKTNDKLIDFVSKQYLKVKTVWKKDPQKYYVSERNNTYFITSEHHEDSIGTLDSLYKNLANLSEQHFTDAHTGTMDYRIGVEARIPRYEGDQSNKRSCSTGLHVASKAYDYSGFGDTPIIVVVNPMDVLAVPINEDGKLRTCAFTPIAVIDEEDENVILEEIDCQNILVEHFNEQLDNLVELVSNNTAYELKINNILGVETQRGLDTILLNLINAQAVINQRVSTIY